MKQQSREVVGSRNRAARRRPLALSVYGIVAIIGVAYAVCLATRAGPIDGLWSVDQGVRVEHVQSLLRNGFRSAATEYPGEVIDTKREFTPLLGQYLYRNGKSFPMFAIAWAALSSPFFALFSYAGLYVIPITATLALLLLTNGLTRDALPPGARGLLIVSLGLATPLAFYSLVFWDHTFVTMLTLLGLSRVAPGAALVRPQRFFGAGLAFGVAIWFRPEVFFAFPALVGAIFIVDRRIELRPVVYLGLGGLTSLAPLFLFDHVTYGFALGPHVLVAGRATYLGRSLAALLERRKDWLAMLVAPAWKGVLGATGALLLIRIARWWPPLHRRQRQLAVCSVLLVLVGIGISRHIGSGLQTSLLATAPLVLLMMLPPPSHSPDRETDRDSVARPLTLFLAAFGLLYILLAFLGGLPDGGVQWGPRMLLPAIVPLVIAGFLRFAAWTGRPNTAIASIALIAAFVSLAAAGFWSEILGIRALRMANEDSHQICHAVIANRQRVVVTSGVQVPSLLAPIFYRGYLVFRADSGDSVKLLARRLATHGFRAFLLIDRPEQTVQEGAISGPDLKTDGPPTILPFGFRATVLRISDEIPSPKPAA